VRSGNVVLREQLGFVLCESLGVKPARLTAMLQLARPRTPEAFPIKSFTSASSCSLSQPVKKFRWKCREIGLDRATALSARALGALWALAVLLVLTGGRGEPEQLVRLRDRRQCDAAFTGEDKDGRRLGEPQMLAGFLRQRHRAVGGDRRISKPTNSLFFWLSRRHTHSEQVFASRPMKGVDSWDSWESLKS
jgi:hypothetical protein